MWYSNNKDKKIIERRKNMHIHTIEENYDYRMKNVMQKFVEDYSLEELDAEELQDKIWSEYAAEFGRVVMEDMNEWSGNELFEIEK